MMRLFHKRIPLFLEASLASVAIGCLIPLIFLLKAIISGQPVNLSGYLFGFVFSFTVSFCIYYFNIRIVAKFQQHEKSFRSQVSRILLELFITMGISGIVMAVVFLAFAHAMSIGLQGITSALFDNIMIAIIVNVIVVVLVEISFFIGKWKNSLVESEQLRRKNMEIQYAALTSQINPHFLFNCLNALSSLIQTDPNKAIVFTREFSKIYRYVLDSKDKLVVSLKEELNFLNSYLYLQKIRFDNGLVQTIDIQEECLQFFLPPLSLQLLVENAIKHNVISEENPLFLTIRGSGTQLTVINNYNPIKKSRSEEGGLGLKNLADRYSHYTDIVPEFRVDNNQYTAIIPLLKDE
jgi:two-component system, LytTR family, sensor kinase